MICTHLNMTHIAVPISQCEQSIKLAQGSEICTPIPFETKSTSDLKKGSQVTCWNCLKGCWQTIGHFPRSVRIKISEVLKSCWLHQNPWERCGVMWINPTSFPHRCLRNHPLCCRTSGWHLGILLACAPALDIVVVQLQVLKLKFGNWCRKNMIPYKPSST